MFRLWTLAVSIVLGATAAWAGYFAWQWRDAIGAQEFLAGFIGAMVGGVVWVIAARRSS